MNIQPRLHEEPVNETFHIICTGSPQNGTHYPVPPGCAVYVRGANGTQGGNTNAVAVGTDRGDVADYTLGSSMSAHSQLVAPNTQIGFPCTDLNEIWIMGSVGDGVQISIQG